MNFSQQEKVRVRDLRARCKKIIHTVAMLRPNVAFLLYDHCRGTTILRLPVRFSYFVRAWLKRLTPFTLSADVVVLGL